jgi:hypothetical protein
MVFDADYNYLWFTQGGGNQKPTDRNLSSVIYFFILWAVQYSAEKTHFKTRFACQLRISVLFKSIFFVNPLEAKQNTAVNAK